MTQAETPPDLPPLVQRALQRLIRAFAPERIVLFGSYAKGTVHSRSDVDLLVIASLDGNPDIHQRRARQLTGDSFPPVDVVFATPAEVAGAAAAKAPFLLSILGTGITLHPTLLMCGSSCTAANRTNEYASLRREGRALLAGIGGEDLRDELSFDRRGDDPADERHGMECGGRDDGGSGSAGVRRRGEADRGVSGEDTGLPV